MARQALVVPRYDSPWKLVPWALLSLLWVGAFAPNPYVLAVVPGVLGMLVGLERAGRARHVVALAVVFGALGIGFGYRWLAPTIHEFSGERVPASAAWLAVALFGAIGTIHLLVFAFVYRAMLRGARRPHPLGVVALFVVAETLPIRLFPWMAGHGAVDCAPIRQAAEWGGVPAVSFVLLCLVVPLREFFVWAADRTNARTRPAAALLTFVLGLSLFAVGYLRHGALQREDDAATKRLRVALVQPNMGAGNKRAAESGVRDVHAAVRAAYERGSRSAIAAGAQLVVWPETAITDPIPIALPEFDALRTNGALDRFQWSFLKELGRTTPFLVGLYERIPVQRRLEKIGPDDQRYNAAALRLPGELDAVWTTYRKSYLIPFGETMPLGISDDLLPQKFHMQASPGASTALEWDGLRIVPFLCYEGILPEHVRAVAGNEHPDLLASLTNDSWFGDSWEPYQHLNFTRFRAVEHAAPLLRATNTGISAFVAANGEVVSSLPLGTEGVLMADVPLVARERTVYARVGHLLPWVLAALALFALVGTRFAPPPPLRNAPLAAS